LIAIVAAMPEEVAPLRARLAGTKLGSAQRSPSWIDGRLDGRDVTIAVTGDGARNARAGAEELLARHPAQALLVLGVSGALTPELATADLIVAVRVKDEEGHTHDAPGTHVAALATATGGRPALVMSARKIADTVGEKTRLARDAQAEAGGRPAVVDLESAAYVAAAERAGVPWMVLRAVSDTAGEALPAILNRSADASGSVNRGRVLRGLFSDPGALPQLLTLRKRVAQCAEVLAHAAAAAVRIAAGGRE
jgi:adenosylhomocysteine nucleosidase